MELRLFYAPGCDHWRWTDLEYNTHEGSALCKASDRQKCIECLLWDAQQDIVSSSEVQNTGTLNIPKKIDEPESCETISRKDFLRSNGRIERGNKPLIHNDSQGESGHPEIQNKPLLKQDDSDYPVIQHTQLLYFPTQEEIGQLEYQHTSLSYFQNQDSTKSKKQHTSLIDVNTEENRGHCGNTLIHHFTAHGQSEKRDASIPYVYTFKDKNQLKKKHVSNEWIWNWSSRPDLEPPMKWNFRHHNSFSLRNSKAMKHGLFSNEMLTVLLLSNVISLTIGGGIGLFIGWHLGCTLLSKVQAGNLVVN
ncbi:uncharacterized protein LOC111087977 isoform X2 [Limulus polyphemus]|uniref:Uncharacterized protein LOC111087977 isoform X2 n=1 Tax=Limulus polyphemus TaxID=6850 RepID=A0ABM1T8T4_LIMPO|nr:uncharacterized protein LOC111087977 isoform X2 [Limulus polyphemus]